MHGGCGERSVDRGWYGVKAGQVCVEDRDGVVKKLLERVEAGAMEILCGVRVEGRSWMKFGSDS